MTHAITNTLRFGSVCSGIEAASSAWLPLGWQCAFTSEIEPFPRAVLAHHYPVVPCHGDFTTIKADDYGPIDILVGGTPCQSFSIAGLRGGLDDDRGNLALEFLRLADRKRPRWLVWENVPGVLSSNGGRDFGAIMGGLVELGYGFAYRVLDAQHFGVPQRRRRVFVVGHSGGLWQRAAAVLFERASLRGDRPPSREAGERVAPAISARTGGGGGLGTDFDCDGGVTAFAHQQGGNFSMNLSNNIALTLQKSQTQAIAFGIDGPDIGFALRASASHSGDKGDGGINSTMVATLMRQREGCDGGGKGPILSHDQRLTLAAATNDHVLFQPTWPKQISDTLNASYGDKQGMDNQHVDGGAGMFVRSTDGVSVRRLTPRECERLQGFKDDFTQIPWRGKPSDQCPDGPRYKALGNSMAVPVMSWIDRRIQQVENIKPTHP